ncbi:hypothetical protein SmJEL517_g03176 [Synchytrium microbalum]|uniref:Transcription initiation factor TFIID subunit 9 n=1 Tax=Synchytrium microbalum TaxID=1806994 RepID=A0A507BXI6_9FUNG|nr:uncharacterized protein SmJEL517_g03176 [Synchytrium microbalum]TPX34030.1 hypothetical protein SmJEL517_g03176 [Synchytrium microbalum]
MATGSTSQALGTLEGDTAQDASQIPRDARLISLLLQSMGIEEYEPRVLHQLLEFMHRYVLDVLNDSMVVADHAGRQEINNADLELAVLSRLEHSFALPPSHDALLELAASKNSIPLPSIAEKFGFRVPPEARTLTSPNFVVTPIPTNQTPEGTHSSGIPQKRKQEMQQHQQGMQMHQQQQQMPQMNPMNQQQQMMPPQQQPMGYVPQQPMYMPASETRPSQDDDEDYDMA